jgi:hypothetical protein
LYQVRVFTSIQGKTARRGSLYLRVDSKAPRYQLEVEPSEGGITLTAIPEGDVFDRNGDVIRTDLVDVKSVSIELAGAAHFLTRTTDGRWQTHLTQLSDGRHRVTLVATDYAQNSSRSVAQIAISGGRSKARVSRAKTAVLAQSAATPPSATGTAQGAPSEHSLAGVRCWFGKSPRRAELSTQGQRIELFDDFLRVDGRDLTPCNGLPAARPVAITAHPEGFLVAFRDGTRSRYHAGAFEPALELSNSELARLAPATRPADSSQVSGGELPSAHVSALATFRERLFVGTFDGGAFSLDAKHEITPLDGAPRFINALLAEPDVLWLASATGLFQLKDGQIRAVPMLSRASHVNDLARAKDGTLWLATSDGLLGLRDGQWRKLDDGQGLASRIVYAVSEGADGTLWAGTAAGVSRISKGGVENFSVENGALPHRWVTALLADESGAYVGSYQGGVTRLDARGATPVPGTGALWLNPHGIERVGERLYAASMGGGLVAFSPAPGDREGKVIKFGPLPSTDVTAVKTFAGALWVGTREGLARLPQ